MRKLSFLSLMYGIITTCLSPVFFIIALQLDSVSDLLLSLAMLVAGVCQWIYSSQTRDWTNHKTVEDTQSLDAWEMQQVEPEQLIKPSLLLQTFAAISGFYELASTLFVVINFRSLFYLTDFSYLFLLVVILFVATTVTLAIPAFIFNMRTWNMTIVAK